MQRLIFPPSFFITGTDTGVGKTVVSAMLAIGLKAGYWKPIQSGLLPQTDTEWVKEATGLPETHFYSESYKLSQPLSPHAAAAIDAVSIDLKTMALPAYSQNHLIVEGAGGIMVPINADNYVIDIIKHLQIPALIVARTSLGTINHTLLTIEQLRRCGIPILGIILNGMKNPGNRHAINTYGAVDILAEIEPMQAIDASSLLEHYRKSFK